MKYTKYVLIAITVIVAVLGAYDWHRIARFDAFLAGIKPGVHCSYYFKHNDGFSISSESSSSQSSAGTIESFTGSLKIDFDGIFLDKVRSFPIDPDGFILANPYKNPGNSLDF